MTERTRGRGRMTEHRGGMTELKNTVGPCQREHMGPMTDRTNGAITDRTHGAITDRTQGGHDRRTECMWRGRKQSRADDDSRYGN